MIFYDNASWTDLLHWRGSVLGKAGKWSVSFALLSVVLNLTLNHTNSLARQEINDMDFGGRLRDFTMILSFFITFRAQKAYTRWWEGGSLLQELRGEWINAFSSLLAFCNPDPRKSQNVLEFQHMLVRMFSLLYSKALQQCSTMEDRNFELISIEGFDPDAMEFLLASHDGCEVVLQWVQKAIVEADGAEIIKIAPPILSRVFNQLGNGMVKLSDARKIREFQIPFPIAQMVWIQLLVHGLFTSFVCAILVSSPYLCAIFTFVVCQSIWVIHYIAIEHEQPYGDDPNDLPLKEMMEDMNKSLAHLLQPAALQPPRFTFDAELHGKLCKVARRLTDFVPILMELEQEKPAKLESEGEILGQVTPTQDPKHLPSPDVDTEFSIEIVDSTATLVSDTEGRAEDKEYRDSMPYDSVQVFPRREMTSEADARGNLDSSAASSRRAGEQSPRTQGLATISSMSESAAASGPTVQVERVDTTARFPEARIGSPFLAIEPVTEELEILASV